MMEVMMSDQFEKVEVYDLKITLREPRRQSLALEAVWSNQNVKLAEAILELPVEMRSEHLKKSVVITGMERDSQLYRPYVNITDTHVPVPEYGIMLGAPLAEALEVSRGDTLTLKTPYTGDTLIDVLVSELIDESMGMNAYMEIGGLSELLSVPKTASAVLVRTDDVPAVMASLVEADNVAAMTDSNSARQAYNDMFSQFGALFYIMYLMAMAVAFAIITNTATISLNERSREYSTLRVVGMHPFEIGGIMAFEYRILTVVGIIAGIPLTAFLKRGLAGAIDTDAFTMPLHTPVSCFVTAAVLCIVTVELSNLMAVRNISKFDMVEVLKERE
jgi:putative ABC transport system permease protein